MKNHSMPLVSVLLAALGTSVAALAMEGGASSSSSSSSSYSGAALASPGAAAATAPAAARVQPQGGRKRKAMHGAAPGLPEPHAPTLLAQAVHATDAEVNAFEIVHDSWGSTLGESRP